jgi:hypothetical protein
MVKMSAKEVKSKKQGTRSKSHPQKISALLSLSCAITWLFTCFTLRH